MIHLITGYKGSAHVTASDMASLNTGIFGTGDYVLNIGQCLKATAIDNNHVKILDGDAVVQGRHIRIPENSYENVTLTNGSQGYKRNDLIVIRYNRNSSTNVETASIAVLKGDNAVSSPSDPEYTDGNIREATDDLVREFPIYRVRFNGITIEQIDQLFNVYDAFETVFTGRGCINRNLLINPWFTVNQRGGNNADCWKFTGCTATRTNVSSFTEIYVNASSSGSISQVFERPVRAGTYTISVYGDSSLNWAFVDGSTNVPIEFDSDGYWSYTFTRNTAIDKIEFVNTVTGVSNGITLYALKLEAGCVSTLKGDNPPNYSEEVLKCQRYIYPMVPTYNASQAVGIGMNATSVRFLINTPVRMKSNPTISYKSGSSLNDVVMVKDGSSVKPTALTAYVIDNGIVINATGSSITTNAVYALKGLNCFMTAEL